MLPQALEQMLFYFSHIHPLISVGPGTELLLHTPTCKLWNLGLVTEPQAPHLESDRMKISTSYYTVTMKLGKAHKMLCQLLIDVKLPSLLLM